MLCSGAICSAVQALPGSQLGCWRSAKRICPAASARQVAAHLQPSPGLLGILLLQLLHVLLQAIPLLQNLRKLLLGLHNGQHTGRCGCLGVLRERDAQEGGG